VTASRPLAALALALVLLAGCGGADQADEPAEAAAEGAAFPVTIVHKYGTTVIPEAPERVVTAGFNDADYALAFGVVPVGERDFIGPFPEERRSWAQEALAGTEPEKVSGEDGELNFEAIAALRPDLILAHSYLQKEEYDKLAQIAPTVVEAKDGSLWQEHTWTVGRALGQKQRANELVSALEERFTQERQEHPEFEGKSAAILFGYDPGSYWLLEPRDPRTGIFTSLGLELPERTGQISHEQAELLDQDVLIVVGAQQANYKKDKLFQGLDAVREGRAVYLGGFETEFAGALGYDSPLSLPLALDILVPKLAAALDGDPQTTPDQSP
jgi:iron complex transport system substrate-binding protein